MVITTKRNVIYFPYMRVPENEWFTRVLLYWDNIYTIVPQEAESNIMRGHMLGLGTEGLIKTINPEAYIGKISQFSEAFLDLVDSPEYPLPSDPHLRRAMPTTLIHTDKMGLGVIDKLGQRGLAEWRVENDLIWAKVEFHTADLYMAYLAAKLGQLPEFRSAPITDQGRSLALFAPKDQQKKDWDREFDDMRTVVLNNVLPAPSGGIDPGKIAGFKRENATLLSRFRNKVESALIDAAQIDDSELRKREIENFILQAEDDVRDLSEAMKAKNWKNITTGRLLAYSVAGLGIASSILGGSLIGAVIAALSLGKTFNEVRKDSKATDILKSNYAAYAVVAQGLK